MESPIHLSRIGLREVTYRVDNTELADWACGPGIQKPHALQIPLSLSHGHDPVEMGVSWRMSIDLNHSLEVSKKEAERRCWKCWSLA